MAVRSASLGVSTPPVPTLVPSPAQSSGPTPEGVLTWPGSSWDTEAWRQMAHLVFADDRQQLAHAVAAGEFARVLAARGARYQRLSESDGRLLTAASLMLHAGSASRIRVTGVPGVDGMMFLAQRGHNRLARLLMHHAAGPQMIRDAGLHPMLALYDADPLQDLLLVVDLGVTASGTRIHPMRQLESCLAAPDAASAAPYCPATLHYFREHFADISAAIRDVERWAGDLATR
jgi:hypothetical protein